MNSEIVNYIKSRENELKDELTFSLCVLDGWGRVIVSPEHLAEIKKWVDESITGDFKWYKNRVAFKESKDYEWFMLKWQ